MPDQPKRCRRPQLACPVLPRAADLSPLELELLELGVDAVLDGSLASPEAWSIYCDEIESVLPAIRDGRVPPRAAHLLALGLVVLRLSR